MLPGSSRLTYLAVDSKESKQNTMSRTNFDQLLEAGVHFGHLTRKWNPAMKPYIFMEKNGIHIIDLHKTVAKIDEAAEALRSLSPAVRSSSSLLRGRHATSSPTRLPLLACLSSSSAGRVAC